VSEAEEEPGRNGCGDVKEASTALNFAFASFVGLLLKAGAPHSTLSANGETI